MPSGRVVAASPAAALLFLTDFTLSVAVALSTNGNVAGGQGRRPWTNAAASLNRVLPTAAEPRAGPAGAPPSGVAWRDRSSGAAVEGARGRTGCGGLFAGRRRPRGGITSGCARGPWV